LGVEAVLAAGVADFLDRVAHDVLVVDLGVGRDFAGDEGEAGRDQRFAGNAADGILREDGVENRVRDLIRDLVGMPFGHRLRRKEMTSVTAHAVLLERKRETLTHEETVWLNT